MEIAKIGLSEEEAALIKTSEWILTKNRILGKVKTLLEEIQEQQVNFLLHKEISFYPEIQTIHPKISRGENYRGLPYFVLDYPRYFKEEGTLAIRTMFWWGNFFSVTLHIAGHAKLKLEERIINSFEELKAEQLFVCVNQGPWEYHFESDNYVALAQLTSDEFRDLILSRNFLKIAGRTVIEEWQQAGKKSMEFFRQFVGLLEN